MIKKLIPVLFIAVAILCSHCKNPDDAATKNTTESSVPPGLKDSIAGKTDESKALDQLKQVVGDSTGKK